MNVGDAGWVVHRLSEDGLKGLPEAIAGTGAFVAGPYLIPLYSYDDEYILTLDIWVPFRDHATKRRVVGNIVQYLYSAGYEFPGPPSPTTGFLSSIAPPELVYRLLGAPSDRVVQLHMLPCRERLDCDYRGAALDRVYGMGLGLLERYYDGETLWTSAASSDAVKTRRLAISREKELYHSWSLDQWLQIMEQVYRYEHWGYCVSEALLEVVMEHVPRAAASETYLSLEKSHTVQITTESKLKQWNILSHAVEWPGDHEPISLVLTVRPPGVACAQLGLVGIREQGDHARDYRSLPPDAVVHAIKGPLHCMNSRYVEWGGIRRLIAGFVPFPPIGSVNNRDPLVSMPVRQHDSTLYDPVTVADLDVQTFLQADPCNRFVVYMPNGRPCAMYRQQLKWSMAFDPSATASTPDDVQAFQCNATRIVRLMLVVGSIYVPLNQLEELMDMPGSGYVQLVSTGIVWDCVVPVGGHTPRTARHEIHYLERMPRT